MLNNKDSLDVEAAVKFVQPLVDAVADMVNVLTALPPEVLEALHERAEAESAKPPVEPVTPPEN
mgnify:CR=1 FL=1